MNVIVKKISLRSIVTLLFLSVLSSFGCFGREPVVWQLGATGEFHINIPGRWTDLSPQDNDDFGYGGAAGVMNRFLFTQALYVEAGAVFGYDDLRLLDVPADAPDRKFYKYSFMFPVNVGWRFEIDDGFFIAPFLALSASVTTGGSFAGHSSLVGRDGVWKRGNFGFGLGFALMFHDVTICSLFNMGAINMVKDKDRFGSRVCNDNLAKVTATYYFTSRVIGKGH